jgi:hypothetical protein
VRSRFAVRPASAPLLAGFAAVAGGTLAALHYHRLGLTLSHYDARGHLVVARRIIDSITPGWQQIGAVWLPLPHLLNALPVQVDAFYRSGASAVAISVASFAVATASLAWIVAALTGSAAAALAAAAVFALNPNGLDLQATPMTEPLLLATTIGAVAMLIAFVRQTSATPANESAHARSASARRVGWAFALACLTRYEAWPVTAAAVAAAAWALWRRGTPFEDALRRLASVAVYPILAVALFAVFSRVVVGQWFVSSGFFVAENKSLGEPVLALKEVGWGLRELSGGWTIWIGATGAAVLVVAALIWRSRAEWLVAASLAATAALPWSAFEQGHPFRIRYMVPLVAIEAIGAGMAAGCVRRAAVPAAILIALAAGYELRPLDARAPMVVEAQWDRPNGPARQRVTDCLVAAGSPHDGEKIMASMGSLGHYMQEASQSGFRIRDYLHEGNGDIWLAALDSPRPYAGWILIEEKAEGGDMLARRAREHPHWLDGYTRVCEGAGLALYRRDQNLKFSVKR